MRPGGDNMTFIFTTICMLLQCIENDAPRRAFQGRSAAQGRRLLDSWGLRLSSDAAQGSVLVAMCHVGRSVGLVQALGRHSPTKSPITLHKLCGLK